MPEETQLDLATGAQYCPKGTTVLDGTTTGYLVVLQPEEITV